MLATHHRLVRCRRWQPLVPCKIEGCSHRFLIGAVSFASYELPSNLGIGETTRSVVGFRHVGLGVRVATDHSVSGLVRGLAIPKIHLDSHSSFVSPYDTHL